MFNALDFVRKEVQSSVETKLRLAENTQLMATVAKVVDEIIACYKRGGKTILAGNGGSAADAQHIAGEFVSRFYFERPGLASIALSSDPSVVTAIGNDYGYERLFARQVEAVGQAGDVLVAISTSGRSPNILEALRVARAKGLVTVGMTGRGGGRMAEFCDHVLRSPSDATPRIQEGHIAMGHTICFLIERQIFPRAEHA